MKEINADPAHARELLASLVEQGHGLDKERGDFRNTDGDAADSSATELQGQHRESSEKRISACVRLAFALGNLTSTSDNNRRLIGFSLGGAETLPALLQSSARAYLAAWDGLTTADGHDIAEHTRTTGRSDRGWESSIVLEESRWRRILRTTCDGLEEMLVKTARLLANININRDVGQRVCQHPGLVVVEPLLGKCLHVFALVQDGALTCGQRPRSGRHRRHGNRGRVDKERAEMLTPREELLLNVVSLVTNLSFYGPEATTHVAPAGCEDSVDEGSVEGGHETSDSGNAVAARPAARHTTPSANILFTLASRARRDNMGDGTDRSWRQDVLCGHLIKVLLHRNAEAVTEAARAFGNFSRDRACREAMSRRRADDVLVVLLSHSRRGNHFCGRRCIGKLSGGPRTQGPVVARGCRRRRKAWAIGASGGDGRPGDGGACVPSPSQFVDRTFAGWGGRRGPWWGSEPKTALVDSKGIDRSFVL